MTKTIEALIAYVLEECGAFDLEGAYDSMLDETSDGCSLCKQYGAARILQEIDPTAYRCGMGDYEDSLGLIELEGSYYEAYDVEKARDEFIDNLESELSDLEDRLEDDQDNQALKAQIETKGAEIAEAKAYAF
jgi:hypothetical protein